MADLRLQLLIVEIHRLAQTEWQVTESMTCSPTLPDLTGLLYEHHALADARSSSEIMRVDQPSMLITMGQV